MAANVTDPLAWPKGMKQCAGMLVRIREIEASCIATHGKWDWELLDEKAQDEYDGMRADLNKIRYRLDEDTQDEFDDLTLQLDRLRYLGSPVNISDL